MTIIHKIIYSQNRATITITMCNTIYKSTFMVIAGACPLRPYPGTSGESQTATHPPAGRLQGIRHCVGARPGCSLRNARPVGLPSRIFD